MTISVIPFKKTPHTVLIKYETIEVESLLIRCVKYDELIDLILIYGILFICSITSLFNSNDISVCIFTFFMLSIYETINEDNDVAKYAKHNPRTKSIWGKSIIESSSCPVICGIAAVRSAETPDNINSIIKFSF